MDKSGARKIIRDTFQSAFDRDRYFRFTRELLNRFDDSAEAQFTYRGKYIRSAYQPYIQSLERLGKYEDAEGNKIDLLVVRLKKDTSLEHARTMQRNFVAWYLNHRGMKDAALVAFVAPEAEDWRFSLVKMEYTIVETPKGHVKAQEEFTPARRYSFLVGTNEASHTAQSRLVPILEDDVRSPTLTQLEDAFNIETVTKEFFDKYRQLFVRLKEALDVVARKHRDVRLAFEARNVDTVDFAKKLLGQIVFLYFLQRKGWFGVKRKQPWGSGSRQFVRELFEHRHAPYKNFFNDILEPLFYEALRLEHPGDYYSRLDCRIPFLNGGLFDPIGD
jgi:hypothetical protein